MCQSSILHSDEAHDVFVVDVPLSIEEQQSRSTSDWKLVSCSALEQPWSSNEPKNEAARAKLPRPTQQDLRIQEHLRSALESVTSIHRGPFCLPRVVLDVDADHPEATSSPVHGHGRKRRAPEDCNPQICMLVPGNASMVRHEVGQTLFHNPTDSAVTCTFAGRTRPIIVPAKSSFLQGDCGDSRAFHEAVRELALCEGTRARFDVVVMDPPWQNASIRRGRQKGQAHYSVEKSSWDMRQLLFDLDLAALLEEDALVGVWVTNKQSVRDLVLSDEDGLFDSWGVELVEEWVWLKVTSAGRPVLPLDGVLRKPYEILLVGRRGRQRQNGECRRRQDGESLPEKTIKQRSIIAVPDVHSRKPNLKKMFSVVWELGNEHRGLEIFARNLTSAWHAWGNEATLFASERYWSSQKADE